MKTLDEVIKAGHICGRYVITDGKTGEDTICDIIGKGFVSDALYYLKEYKIKRERVITKAQDCEDAEKHLQDEIAWYQKVTKDCEEILTDYVALKQYWAEQQANNPLTWEELKQMEGKPVWVEHLKNGAVYKAGWCLIVQVDDSLPEMAYIGLVDTDTDYRNLEVDWMAMGQWQAYRKERS